MSGGTGTDTESKVSLQAIVRYTLLPGSFINDTEKRADVLEGDIVHRITSYSDAGIMETSRLFCYVVGAYEIGKRVVEYF